MTKLASTLAIGAAFLMANGTAATAESIKLAAGSSHPPGPAVGRGYHKARRA